MIMTLQRQSHFLKEYGLDKDFKMNIEANHATLAGHTFQHDLRVSAMNGMLGSIDVQIKVTIYLDGIQINFHPMCMKLFLLCMKC